MKYLVHVGEHNLAISCQSEEFNLSISTWFDAFEIQTQSDLSHVDLTVEVEQGYGASFVDYHVEINSTVNYISYRRADYHLMLASDYRKAKLQAYDALALKHALMNLYSAFIVHFNWGLLIHSSCVADQNQAYMFAGHSGAGKSTVSQLSSPRPILSDEATLVKISEHHILVYDSPFRSEMITRYPDHFCQLSKILLLNQSTQNETTLLTKSNAMICMLDKIFFWPHHPFETTKLLKMCKQLVDRIPAYQLYFQKNNTFWEMIS